MGVSEHLASQRGITSLRTPVLAKRDEELLVAGEPVLHRSGLPPKRGTISVIRSRYSGQISNIARAATESSRKLIASRPSAIPTRTSKAAMQPRTAGTCNPVRSA